MTTEQRESLVVFRLQRPVLIGSAIALALCLLGALLTHDGLTQFLRSYLVGLVFITGLAIGAVGVLAMQYLTGGMWGAAIRKSLEAASRTLPLIGLAFIPLLFGIGRLYLWSHEDVVAHDKVLQSKAAYLNAPFFIGRTIAYFAIWLLIVHLLNRWSREYEETGNAWAALRVRRLSAAVLLILAVTLTFASVDWVMSLEPHWYSTMYGISFMVGSMLSALALASLIASLLSEYEPLSEIFRAVTYRDLGNLLLAFVMLWAYTAFSQFLLIWYGNIREEVPYYIPRTHGGWGVIALLLVLFHFFLPFGLLLMRRIKDNPQTLRVVALLILFMRILDHYWIIAPAFREHGAEGHGAAFHPHWMDPLAILGLSGLWFAAFLWQLERRPLVPRNDPVLEEALSHG